MLTADVYTPLAAARFSSKLATCDNTPLIGHQATNLEKVMNTKREWVLKAALAFAMPVLSAMAGSAEAAKARAASASATKTGSAGNTATRQSHFATNTYSRSATTTGPNGSQSSFATSVQATGDGLDRSATRTGPGGKSISRNSTVTAAPAGTPPG